ncbi:MAG: symmetrical bis(5'-nucleosyl)-tetraphosphatase [Gammaproteobacteria bacterium]
MATYAIGDVQGCWEPLLRLLDECDFHREKDRLWFVGDLVNRGPDSLAVLRFVRGLGDRAVTVLGNHDLHLLAVAAGIRKASRKDSLGSVLEAADRDELLDWLRHLPLAHQESALPHLMVHAGVPPGWSAEDTLGRAREVESALRGPDWKVFLAHMYGDHPDCWDDALAGWERLRVITNYLTRMRFCTPEGRLDLDNKNPPAGANTSFAPWFSHAGRAAAAVPVVFGHWAALEGKADTPGVHALDTGCVWGGRLRAMRLEDGALFHSGC